MLDLQQLRYFVAVAQTGSIARAAEQLHISQSPLSRQVIALEARLGLGLFARQGKRLRLTRTGGEFLVQAQSLLAAAIRLEDSLRDTAAGQAGLLSIGYVESALHMGVLRKALRDLQKLYPRIRLQLSAMRSAAQFDALGRGDIDMGFAHRGPPGVAALQSRRIAQEPFVLALPASHRLASGAFAASGLSGEVFIFPSHGGDELLAECRRAGFDPQPRHQAGEPLVALSMVAAGLGLAVVQQSLERNAPAGVKFQPLPGRFSSRLQVHAVTPKPPTALAGRLLQLCAAAG